MGIIGRRRFTCDRIPTDGLLAEYLFDGEIEPTGGSIYDTSGNGNTLTALAQGSTPGSVQFVASGRGKYLYASGGQSTQTGTTIQHASWGKILTSLPFTISVWCHTGGSSNSFGTLQHITSEDAEGFYFKFDSGAVVLELGESSISWSVSPSASWTHLCLTCDSQRYATLYMDGISQGQQQSRGTLGSSSNTMFGFFGTDVERRLSYSATSQMDNLRFYNRVLTADEISILANERR